MGIPDRSRQPLCEAVRGSRRDRADARRMEKRTGNKKLPIVNRENIAVSRPEPMVSIPVAQVVAVAVPLLIVGVPVAVPVQHGTGFVFRTI